jgi:hypothetical protein
MSSGALSCAKKPKLDVQDDASEFASPLTVTRARLPPQLFCAIKHNFNVQTSFFSLFRPGPLASSFAQVCAVDFTESVEMWPFTVAQRQRIMSPG